MRVLALLAVIGVSSSIPVFDDQILLAVPRLKNSHDSLNSHPIEWIQGPDSHLYQFHVGKQTWLAAREYCLARNSDLVHLKDKNQLDWVLEHYNPILSGVERVVQIGVLKSKHEWKWVDGSELKTDVVDWKKEEKTSDETCALLQLNDTRLIKNACDETVLARFVCQRTNDAHEKQQRSDNFFWSRLETLFDYFGIGKGSAPSTEKPVPDYYDEDSENSTSTEKSTEVNITSAERQELASIPISSKALTSSEEEDQVDKVLSQLSKIPSVLPEKPKTSTRSSEEDNEEQTDDFHDFKVHRSPAKSLKEISDVEGSGQLVNKYEISAEEKITVEDPHKLQNIIDNMEKMLADIEKIKVPGDAKDTSDEKTSQTSSPDDNLLTADSREVTKSGEQASIQATTLVPKDSEESSKTKSSEEVKDNSEEAEKPRASGVKNNAVSNDLEEDFDSEKEKSMPVADIKPKSDDEDCDEKTEDEVEGSGEDSSNLQKPSIPKDREEHIRKFLKTLRVFLARASHDDLRSVLDDKNQKSLLERMEGVIKQANAREFARLDNAENGNLLPQQDDTSVMMDEKEQEDLFKRISDVVLQQAQKEGIILTATEPSVRTTTEEVKTQKSIEEKKNDDESAKDDSDDSDDADNDEEGSAATPKKESSEEIVVVKKSQRQAIHESHVNSKQSKQSHSPPALKKAAPTHIRTNTEAQSTTKAATTTTASTTTPRVTTSTHRTTTTTHKKARARHHRQEKKEKDERNPLGLPKSAAPTVAPLPTFAPLPSLQEVFEKWDKSFKDLFKPLPTLPPPKF